MSSPSTTLTIFSKLAERWRDHTEYWLTAPIEKKIIRYEDISATVSGFREVSREHSLRDQIADSVLATRPWTSSLSSYLKTSSRRSIDWHAR